MSNSDRLAPKRTSYKVVYDMEALHSFVFDFLPELSDDEAFYVALFARKKYNDSGLNGSGIMKSAVIRSKEHFINRVLQMEVPLGTYQSNKGPVEQDALALYVSINPRALKAAAHKLVHTLVESMYTGQPRSPHSAYRSAIQRSKSKTRYVDFDIDSDLPVDLNTIINADAYRCMKTRGGYHILVEPSKVEDWYKNTWYKTLKALSDKAGDILTPVPGCVQGDFIPHFI